MKIPNSRKEKKAGKPPSKMPKKKKKMPKSSSSNPTTMKFREAAKKKQGFGGRFLGQDKFSNNLSGSQPELTLEALEKHNATTGGFTESMLQDDATSVGGTTFNTWATNMTGCTNVTFSRVHRYINSNSSVQKEILAVLAAVTEVIKEKGGEGKDVQYFAVLVTSLQEAEKADTRMAMSHLLSIVIKKVPVSVLQSRFSHVLKALMTVMTDCVKKNNIAPIKPSLSCLASLLRVQQPSVWADSSTEQAYRALLAFVTHKKPKLRKAGQRAVMVVLRGSIFMQNEGAPQFHPAASITAKYCQKAIESTGGLTNRVDILHLLSLLKEIIGVFPYSETKSLCETLLRLMTLTDLVVRSSCMEVLYHLFLSKPMAKSLPAEMNGQIITALYDYQPSEKDGQPVIAWLSVMQMAAVCLASRDPSMCLSHLPRLFSTCMTCLLSDRQDVATAAVTTMKSLLSECLALLEEKLTNDNSGSPAMTAIQKIVKAMEAGLSYQFHSTWAKVLHLWADGFLVIGKIAPQILAKCLTSLGDLRDTPHFSYKADMDCAIGAAVKAMGPKTVLASIPLGITGENDNLEFPRGWMVPVIRDNVTHTELGFFTSYFLPLAAKLKSKADSCAQASRIAESRAYDTLQQQIWSMLKGFCDCPTDLKKSFQGIAKTLGTALNDREDLRMDVMASLRSLISCSLEKEDDKKELARFAKNFLPILFNQYTTEGILKEGTRQAVLETVKKFLMISDDQVCKIRGSKARDPEEQTLWLMDHKESCHANYSGSSGGMEAEAAKVLWGRSMDYGLRYTTLIGDGDSKTFNAIQDLNPYNGVEVKKAECVNHVAKRLGTALRNLVNTEKKRGVTLGGRGSGTLTQLVASFMDKCLDKLKEEDISSFRSIALIDLARVMIPHGDTKRLKQLLKLCTQKLKKSEDRTVQKKAYRILEEICGSETSSCLEILKSSSETIRKTLVESLSKSGPSTKAPRLRCLCHIFKKLTVRNDEFLMSTLPEAILCTKEIGTKARAAAYELIVIMSQTYLQWNADKPEREVLDDFIGKVSAGLAGSPDMISATILALTRIVFEYKARLSGSVLDFLVKNVCVLLNAKNREVIKTGLGFIKVLLSAFDNTILAAHLKDLLNGMQEIAVKGNARRLTKIIYLKLIKKFGFELIMNMTDQKVHKLLKNIHKTQEREKRKADQGKEVEEEDEEEDDDEKPMNGEPESIEELLQDTDSELEDDEASERLSRKQEKKKKKKGKDAWLMETGEDEIVDFMDPSAAKQILTTKPKANIKESKLDKEGSDRGFKMTPDGRLIIKDDGGEEEVVKGRPVDSDEDDLDDLFNQYEEGLKNKARKRKRGLPAEEDTDDEDIQPSSKYKAGGSGIHRPVAKAKRTMEIGTEYKAKKASGDVKKSGRPDPYAYVPLNFNHLNKRKQMKAKGVFKNLVKGAKKGAGKGAKDKAQRGRRK